MSALKVLTPREASIFACLADLAVAPDRSLGLPPVAETSCVASFDDWLAHCPRVNRTGYKLMLYALELAPRIAGRHARLRRLDRPSRETFLRALERSRLRNLTLVLTAPAQLSYYGDDAVSRRLGYDRAERLERARRIRQEERLP